MDLVFCPLFSGSTGNCCFAAAHDVCILVDAGGSAARIEAALRQVGASLRQIDGVLITHEHIDHIQGVGVLARKGLKIYANEATWQAMLLSGKLGEIPRGSRVVFGTSHSFGLGRLGITPLPISHDAADPVGFVIQGGRRRIALITDTGHLPPAVEEETLGADILMLESNHDIALLEANAHYPLQLKRRILGNKGHLSNDAAAQILPRYAAAGTTHIVLAHLSQENNTPELAFDTAAASLARHGVELGRQLQLGMSWPHRVGEIWGV